LTTSLNDYAHNERQPRNGHISGAVTRMSSDQSGYAPQHGSTYVCLTNISVP